MRSVLARAAPIAASDAPVVILGETGTGKEVLARTLHATSARAAHAFVPVNCGAIPSELMESELFGHLRGSFTGAATDRAGLFEAAERGTLFLDEVSELPAHLQVKLLRVLQDGEVRRVGSTELTRVDVRILAATNRDLGREVARGAFRQDPYYRLKVFSIALPPLRARAADILPIARQLLGAGGAQRPGLHARGGASAAGAPLAREHPGALQRRPTRCRARPGGARPAGRSPGRGARAVAGSGGRSRARVAPPVRGRARAHPRRGQGLRGPPGRSRAPRHRAQHIWRKLESYRSGGAIP